MSDSQARNGLFGVMLMLAGPLLLGVGIGHVGNDTIAAAGVGVVSAIPFAAGFIILIETFA